MAAIKRTRRWLHVGQEAVRLSALGLTATEIAKQISVNKSTVTRWMKAGKLSSYRGALSGVQARQTPGQWAADLRDTYALSSSDDQLVSAGEIALLAMYSETLPMSARLAAMGRFQAIVKQLALVAKSADLPAETPAPTPAAPEPSARAPRNDPRRGLMAVK